MKLVPAVLLLAVAAFAVFFGGVEGAGVLALAGAFLTAFSLLLFRRATAHADRNRRAETDAQFLWMLILGGIALRVVATLLLRGFSLNRGMAPDEETYHDNGQYFAAWLRGDVPRPFSYTWAGSTQVGYFALVGTIYSVFGEFPVLPVLLNCVVGGLCAYPAYLFAARIGGRTSGRWAAALVTFFPSLTLWSALLIRDAWVLFFLLWSACLAQSLLDRFRLRTLAWLVLCLAALGSLRSYLLVLTAAAAVAAFLVAGVRRPGRAIAAAVACAVAVIVLMRVAGLGADYLGDASFRGLAMRRQFNAMGGATAIGLEGHDLSTPTGALAYLPVGLAWFLLAPFPWQWLERPSAVPEMAAWYVCVPFVVSGALFALRRRRRQAIVPLFMGVLVTLLYALVEGNVGIIFRHRAQALALFLPFAAIGLARMFARARRERRRTLAPARRTTPRVPATAAA